MKERTKAELEEIQYVSNQRKIEQAECEASKDVVSGPTSARNTPLVGKNFCTGYGCVYVFQNLVSRREKAGDKINTNNFPRTHILNSQSAYQMLFG